MLITSLKVEIKMIFLSVKAITGMFCNHVFSRLYCRNLSYGSFFILIKFGFMIYESLAKL